MTTVQEVLELAQAHQARRLDLKVTDLFGRWHHFGLPVARLEPSLFEQGIGIDGSSLPGFGEAHESDLVLRPDPATAVIDPVPQETSVSMVCDIVDPQTGRPHPDDPRGVARRAEAHLANTGIASSAAFGTKLEFFVFDDVRYQQGTNTSFYFADSNEAGWNAGREELPNLAYKSMAGRGYAAVPPTDTLGPVRWAIVEALQAVGATVELEHREAGTVAHGEVTTARSTLLAKADEIQWFKYLVRNVARRHGRVATFMPKPIHGERGAGMHTHQSLWRDSTPLFFDSNGYAALSQTARHYIGGLLRHAPAVLAFTNPGTNSYRRFVPGMQAPLYLAYSARNRTAAVRIPTYSARPAEKRIEFRAPDGLSNPYLALSAMLMAGIDGVQNRIDPGDPLDRKLDDPADATGRRAPGLPRTLSESLLGLQGDPHFLRQGDVFPAELITRWLTAKLTEAIEVAERPTPFEYELYFSD